MAHTHPPGEPCSHGPQHVVQQTVPDPTMQAQIDQDFKPVNLDVAGTAPAAVTCAPHKLDKCPDCNLDFVNLNRIAKLLTHNPVLKCPPPPNVVSQQLSKVINTTKEEGNVRRLPALSSQVPRS